MRATALKIVSTPADLPPVPEGRTGWPWVASRPVLPPLMATHTPWPRVSIVTPSLNQGAFLEAALRSVLLQGYPNLELIVVDGGSADESADVLARYRPWLTETISGTDAGPASALNSGFARATGDILGFLNADDFLLPGCCERVAKGLARTRADVISGHGYFATPDGKLGAPLYSDRWHPRRFAYGACVLMQPATFFRRHIFRRVGGFSELTRTAWDQQLWADMAMAGALFTMCDEPLAAFRLHRGSITGSETLRGQRHADSRSVLELMRGRPEDLRDRLFGWLLRLRKVSGHPLRTLQQRMFVRATLKRWSL